MQKTAYEWRMSDWSSDVCSSDLDTARSAGGLSRCRPPDCRHRDEPEWRRLDRRRAAPAFTGGEPAAGRHWRGRGALRGGGARRGEAETIGRASWRERACQHGYTSVVAIL